VVDLMVRLAIGAVPVVGDGAEVLGMVTSGDALGQLMHEQSTSGVIPQEPLTARHVMTRSVMCVSEGQPLIEAAHMMLHRDVDQIPVARDGRLVGIVTRANVLRALHRRNTALLMQGQPS
jgi:CBS domain-containing protein